MGGTRRIGPDLAREAAKRPKDWQLVHLYNPRYLVPDSMMPSYRWLFKGDPDSPTEDARHLVAYLNVLGRSAMQSSSSTTSANTPATLISLRRYQQLPTALKEGKGVFLPNCSACHG